MKPLEMGMVIKIWVTFSEVLLCAKTYAKVFYIYLILRVNLSGGSYYYHLHVAPRETVQERSGGLSDLT